jgi:hypothetical protein
MNNLQSVNTYIRKQNICTPVYVYAIISVILILSSLFIASSYKSITNNIKDSIWNLLLCASCSIILLIICKIPEIGTILAWIIIAIIGLSAASNILVSMGIVIGVTNHEVIR